MNLDKYLTSYNFKYLPATKTNLALLSTMLNNPLACVVWQVMALTEHQFINEPCLSNGRHLINI